MSRADQGQAGNARDDSGNGGHPAPSVRQGELPVRELSYSERSRTRVVMLPPGEVEAVRAATERYRAARKHLEEEANAGLAQLISRLHRR